MILSVDQIKAKRANFGARARVIDLLGREQIADAPTALSELLKNSVDALASRAKVSYNSKKKFLSIDDNGLGMRRADLLNKWLVIATESKRGESDATYYEFADEGRLEQGSQYPPLGEKGIGRLAVAALGRGVLIWTRWGAGEKAERTLLFIHWNLFRHPRLSLDDIIIPYLELGDRAPIQGDVIELFGDLEEWMIQNADVWITEEEKQLQAEILKDLGHAFLDCLEEDLHFALQAGTLFCVLGTEPEVDRVFADQIAAGEEKREIEGEGIRLLLGFCDPFGAIAPRLDVQFDVDGRMPSSEREFWTKADFVKADHEISFTVNEKGWVRGKLRRFSEEIDYEFQSPPMPNNASLPGPLSLHIGYVAGREESKLSEEEFARYNRRLINYGALYIYRDGVRVLPYGRAENDFLRFEERRSLNAGRYFFSHRRMFGALYIGKKSNPKLQDKAGREGFIRNASYRGLYALLTSIFVDLALSRFGRESDSPDKVERRAKRQSAVEQQRERARQATVDFKRDLTNWKRRLPVVVEETREHIESATRSLDEAANFTPGSKDATNVLSRCQSAIDAVRRQVEKAEKDLKTEAPAIISLKREVADSFDGYLSERAQWQQRSTRELGRLVVQYEGLAAQHRSEQERLEAVQRQIEAAQREAHSALQAGFEQFQEVTRSVLQDRSKHWLDEQQKQLSRMLTDALGQNIAADIISDSKGEKAILLERTLAEMRRTAQEDLRPFWETLTDQLRHLDMAEAGDLALGALNREVEELRERERTFSELAQLGLIVESLDHEYNVLFSNLQKALHTIEVRLKKDEVGSQAVTQARMVFDNLQLKLQVLSPLYRRKLGALEDLRGAEVRRFLEGLHPQSERGDVNITYTHSFLSQVIPQVNGAVVQAATANIVANALYWTTQVNSAREIRFTTIERGFVISDSGPGVSPRDRARIFEPFVGRRPDGRGLGLYIAKINLDASGLELSLAEEPLPRALDGANFIIRKRES